MHWRPGKPRMEPSNSDFKMKMAERFKLRLSRVVPAFPSCRSKDPAALPCDPLPYSSLSRDMSATSNQFHSQSESVAALNTARFISSSSSSPSFGSLSYSQIMRHLVTIFTSMGCGTSRSCYTSFVPMEGRKAEQAASEPPENMFQWLQEEKWLVAAKLCREDDNDSAPRRKIYLDSTPLFPQVLVSEDTNTGRVKRKKLHRLKRECETNQRIVEKESLVASSSSTDVPSRHDRNDDYCYEKRSSRRRNPCPISKLDGRSSASCDYENDCPSPSVTTPPRLSRFQWMIPCAVEGKVRESFAVVKRSDEPYEDFKRSMLEMVVEKRMFERDDLERLLNCFLSLNSEDHHGVIVEAFSEVWRTLFAP